MLVTFVRTAAQKDRIYVARDDGTEASWSFPTYGDGLPHDLVHLIVEAVFDVAPGIWGRVSAGLDLGRINAEANRAGGKHKYAAMGTDLADVYVSEALANTRWADPTISDRDRLVSLEAAIDALPAAVDLEHIALAREALAEARRRWQSLLPKGALAFAHPGAHIIDP